MTLAVADPPAGSKSTIKSFLAQSGRFVIAVLMGALAIFVGIHLGDFLKGQFSREPVAVLGGALVLATFKEGLSQLQGLALFVRYGTFSTLYALASFAMIAAATLVASAFKNDPPPSAPQSSVYFLQGAAGSGGGTIDEFTISIPFFNEATVCGGDWGAGTKLNPSTEQMINDISRGLAHCAVNQKNVEIVLRGFASSRSTTCDGGDEANKDLANARAARVKTVLGQGIDSERDKIAGSRPALVNVDVREWETLAEMRSNMRFNDKQGPKFVEDRGHLTRRVDMVIRNAGDCQVAGLRR